MFKKYIYIIASMAVVAAVVVITVEIPHYSKMIGFETLMYVTLGLTVLVWLLTGYFWWGKLRGEDQWVAGGSCLLFGFVILLAAVSGTSRAMSSSDCLQGRYPVHHYEARYTSGYGAVKGDTIVANQWVLSILKGGVRRTFTLRESVTVDDVTNTVNLEFCNGILDTKYLREK